jgi:hypothetical protein
MVGDSPGKCDYREQRRSWSNHVKEIVVENKVVLRYRAELVLSAVTHACHFLKHPLFSTILRNIQSVKI